MARKKTRYEERNDMHKVQSNWTKMIGLIERKEYSGAIVRAVTATEIAANYVIKRELVEERNLELNLVNNFLKWANGIQGKFEKLIMPIARGKPYAAEFKILGKKAADINKIRNEIVHSGRFADGADAEKIKAEAREIITKLIRQYEINFELDEAPSLRVN